MPHPIHNILFLVHTIYLQLKSFMHSPPDLLLHHHLHPEIALLGHSAVLCHSDMHPKSS